MKVVADISVKTIKPKKEKLYVMMKILKMFQHGNLKKQEIGTYTKKN